MAKVTETDEARRWLQEIDDHIAQNNPDAAYGVVTNIFESAGRLVQFPELGLRYKGDARFAFSCAINIASPT